MSMPILPVPSTLHGMQRRAFPLHYMKTELVLAETSFLPYNIPPADMKVFPVDKI